MIRDSSTLQKGQLLRVEINEVKDRLPQNILEDIRNCLLYTSDAADE